MLRRRSDIVSLDNLPGMMKDALPQCHATLPIRRRANLLEHEIGRDGMPGHGALAKPLISDIAHAEAPTGRTPVLINQLAVHFDRAR